MSNEELSRRLRALVFPFFGLIVLFLFALVLYWFASGRVDF